MKAVPPAGKSWWVIIIAWAACGCANIVSPTGGPKDTTPPGITNSLPPNLSTWFSSKEIKITFNEFITLKEERKNLLISPPLESFPECRIKGKSLIISIEGELRDSTTYTFSFGNSIQDITENNPLKNFQYIFSTGPSLDSMTLSGKAVLAFDNKPVKDATIMLYTGNEDSLPLKNPPDYVCRTAMDGSFRFNFIGNRPYKVFGLLDMNNNYLYDQPAESIAFADSLIRPAAAVHVQRDSSGRDSLIYGIAGDELLLYMFVQQDSIPKPGRPYLPKPYQLLIPFSCPVEMLTVKTVAASAKLPSDWSVQNWNNRRDTLTFWLKPEMVKDSLNLELSLNGKAPDTLIIDLKRALKGGRQKIDGPSKMNWVTNATGKIDLNKPVYLHFDYPITTFCYDSLKLKEENKSVSPQIHFTDSVKNVLTVFYPWKENNSYELYIPPLTLKNITGQNNDSISLKFRSHALKDYAVLKLSCIPPTDDLYIIQLLSGEKEIIAREEKIKGNKIIKFEYLTPGEYRIKAIHDQNANGFWDSGNYFRKKKPERSVYFDKKLDVRANWEMEEEWPFP